MKHGDKKAKSAGKASEASGKKSSSKDAVEAAGPAGKNGKERDAAKTGSKAGRAKVSAGEAGNQSGSSKAAAEKSEPATLKVRARAGTPADGEFTNPVIADAFKRAVKKYPNAFRRLTD